MARRVNEAGAALKTVGHLFWLQRRLLLNGLLRGDARSRGRLLLTGLILLGTLPYLAVGTVGLYIALRSVDPGTAERILAVGMGALLMFWAMAPLTGQPLLENVGYLRLLHQPLSLLSLALGGQFSGLFSLLGVISAPVLLAAALGTARGPIQTMAALLTVVLVGWIMLTLKAVSTLLADLASEDRRLRTLASFLLMVGFLVVYFDQMGLQRMAANSSPGFFRPDALSTKLATWLPAGWAAHALLSLSRGDMGAWMAMTLLLAVLGAALVPLQLLLLRRLLWGDLLRGGAMATGPAGTLRERPILPGLGAQRSRILWGLLRKDWLTLQRSPMTLRLSIVPILFGFMAWQVSRSADMEHAPPALIALAIGGMAGFVSGSMGNNRFGMYDHVGTGTLLASPAPRHLILFSHGLLQLVTTGVIALACAAGSYLARPSLLAPLLILSAAAAAGLVITGLGQLCSVRFPTYVDLERGRAETNQSSFAGVLVILLGSPLLLAPSMGVLVAAALLRPSWLPACILAALIYGAVLYLILLTVSARMLPDREPTMLKVLVDGR